MGSKNEEMITDASSYTGNFDREMIRQKQIGYRVISDRLVCFSASGRWCDRRAVAR